MIVRFVVAFVFTAAPLVGSAQDVAPFSDSKAVAFVQSYCLESHSEDEPEAGLNLESFTSVASVSDSIDAWNKIADRVDNGQMPPPGSEMPAVESRRSMVGWVRQTIHATVCGDGVTPGGPMLRRFNRNEYANTLRDLLGIHVNAAYALPDDGAGGQGFDNASETLFISPIHAEKYLDAARSALDHAFKDPRSRARIIVADPHNDRTPTEAAREVLSEFLPSAFRRPVSDDEVDRYTELFETAFESDGSYIDAIQVSLEAVLVSPKFLFLYEEPPQAESTVLVSQYELACRLSYFLWASMPDEPLMQAAAEGKLHDQQVLSEQVVRMLKSDIDGNGLRRGAKVREFATSFTEQWLGTRSLGREWKPDDSIADGYDSELEGGMKYEPIFFMEELLADNRSLLNLIDSDFTYVNRRLARHYGIKGEFREQPKRVELQDDSHRGGLLGMSAVLAVSSYPHRTSPVLRGKWILSNLLGTPPAPPPPDVGTLDESSEPEKPTSLRQRLELHRANSTCAACHASMDPLGFGLENFDALGRWRTEVDSIQIDASGKLVGGEAFVGPEELKQRLMEQKDQIIRNLTAKMLGYALARGLTNEDACVVQEICDKLAADGYRAQTLVIEIVKSIPFRYKRGHDADP